MANNGTHEKGIVSERVLERSVQKQPATSTIPGNDAFTLFVSSFADDITPWGKDIDRRDRQLREFWPTEPFIASAINSIVQARANMSWQLDGPPRTVNAVQRMLQSSDLGRGWLSLRQKVEIDLLTQDNGGFVEVVRLADAENSPVVNLAHLDAAQCTRTGVDETPVIYYDLQGVPHHLKWYQVLMFEDMPSPIQSMFDVQYCFLTRVLRAAQIIKDIGIFKREKISGRNPSVIHLVSGVQTKLVEDKITDEAMRANNQGYTRYQTPVVIGSLDPTANVSVATINLKDVPDGFDDDTTLRWYISNLALGAGGDYQDFAPLSSGGLGSGQQSEMLHRKAKGKGHETARKLWEHKLNFSGILPSSVIFAFDEDDTEEKDTAAQLAERQSKVFSTYFKDGVLTLPVIHQMMQDEGILKPEYVAMMGEQDVTPDIVVDDEEPAPTQQELDEAETVEPEDAVKRVMLRRILKKKQIDEDVIIFEDELTGLSNDLANGDISESDFIEEAGILVAQAIITTFLEASGKSVDELNQTDIDIIDEQTEINLDAIPGLAASILVFADEDDPEELIDDRLSLWGRSVFGIWAMGQLRVRDAVTTFYTWALGIADHCVSCVGLDGVIRSATEWQDSPFRPQVKNGSLACGGWECKCRFVQVQGPSVGTLPSPAR